MRSIFIKLMLGLLAIMVVMFLGLSAIVAYEYGLLDKALARFRASKKGGRHVEI